MSKLSKNDLFELSKGFHNLSVTIGNFRFYNWNELTKSQRDNLEALQWTLFNTSSDLNAKSVQLKMSMLADDIAVLKSSTVAMQAAAEKISDVKHAIRIATKALAFGGALYLAASTGNITALVESGKALVNEIEGQEA